MFDRFTNRAPRDWFDNHVWRVSYRVVKDSVDDDATGLAAEIAFYGMFSLFPFVILLRSLEQYLPENRRIIPFILSMIQDMTTDGGRVYELARQLLREASQQQNSLLSLGIIFSLWGASRGFGVVVKGINRAYDIEEERSWFEQRLFGLAITIVLLVFLLGGITLALFGRRLLGPALETIGLGFIPTPAVRIIVWPVALLLLLLGLAIMYHFAPAKRGTWRWTTPGSIFAVVAMLVLSWGLSFVLSQNFFEISWMTFSSLGMLLAVLLWMFLMGMAVIVGGEINAVLDRNLAEGGLQGEATPGADGPVSEPPTDDDGRPVRSSG